MYASLVIGLIIVGLATTCRIDFGITLTCSDTFDTSQFTPQELENIVFIEIANTTIKSITIDSSIFINLRAIALKNNPEIQCDNIQLLADNYHVIADGNCTHVISKKNNLTSDILKISMVTAVILVSVMVILMVRKSYRVHYTGITKL